MKAIWTKAEKAQLIAVLEEAMANVTSDKSYFWSKYKENIALYESLSWFSKFLKVGADIKEEISIFKSKHDFISIKIGKLYKIKSAVEFALDSDAAEVHLTEDDINHIRKCCIVIVR